MSGLRPLALLALGAAPLAVASAPLAAQGGSCVDSIPRTALRATVAHLVAEDLGEGAMAIPALAREDVQAIADAAGLQLRMLLGGSKAKLPPRDPTLQWRGLMGHAHMVVRRDGTMGWSYPWGAPGHRAAADSLRESGVMLVGHALEALRRGNPRAPWPDGLNGVDSIAFQLRFVWPDPRADGSMGEMPVRDATPVLRVDVPVFTPMRVVKRATVAYPEAARVAQVRTTITMQYQVDTAGHVPEESIRDVWRDARPRPAGVLADYYRELQQAVRRSIVGSRYEPARFGGCKVPQLVEQEFTFGLKGRIWDDNQ